MAKKIVGVLAVVIAVFLIVVATRPATFEIKRSQLINAPADIIFAQVIDFKAWSAWSPWEKRDPAMKRTYNEVPSGLGAGYHWIGNKDVGEGSMKITDVRPNEHVGLDLEFLAPWAAKHRTDIDLVKSGEGTTVTWTMSGTNGFGSKAMSLFMDMDKMVGPDFEKGLVSMKAIAEAEAARRAADAKAAEAAAPPPAPVDAPMDAGTP